MGLHVTGPASEFSDLILKKTPMAPVVEPPADLKLGLSEAVESALRAMHSIAQAEPPTARAF